jgi:hypothetical protein
VQFRNRNRQAKKKRRRKVCTIKQIAINKQKRKGEKEKDGWS